MSKKIFLTGANGFIGGRLAAMLVKRGYEVTCLVRDPQKVGALKSQGVTLIKGDITDKESLRQAMRGSDAVFHLAGWYAIGVPDRPKMHAINVDGARNTLELAAELGVPKILHTSTVGVFGNTHGKAADESYRVPKEEMGSEYELTKWLAHYEVAVPLQEKGAPVIILQPGGVTGAGDESPHILTFKMFLQKMPVMMGAKSGLTFAHVDDVAEGHILAFEKGKAGAAYILAGEPMNYRQLFELCEKITGIRGAKLWMPGYAAGFSSVLVGALEKLGLRTVFSSEALATLNDYTFWGTAEKAKRELGWKPRPIEDTLKEILNDLEKR
jgi:dihydroflavonol-4-reductase